MCKVSLPCPRLASGLAAVLERGHSPLPSTGLAFSMAGKEEGEAMAGWLSRVPETCKCLRLLVLVEAVELNAGGNGMCAINLVWPF